MIAEYRERKEKEIRQIERNECVVVVVRINECKLPRSRE
jgi:hypothetical protein